MKLLFATDPRPLGVGIHDRSKSYPVAAAALVSGVSFALAYPYADWYITWATAPTFDRLQKHMASVEKLEALCVEAGPEAACQFHTELQRAFIEGRLRQSAFW